MATEEQDESFSKLFAVIAAVSTGGILEMCGGAPRDRIEFQVASICFSISLPLAVFGYFTDETLQHRKNAGGTEKNYELILVKYSFTYSVIPLFLGLIAIFSFFSTWAAGFFCLLGIVGVLINTKSIKLTQVHLDAHLKKTEMEAARLSEELTRIEYAKKQDRNGSS